jgi:hypothetical protein
METRQIVATILIIGLAVLVFAFCRAFILWYFKIDTRIKLQERQNELLEQILKKNEKVTGDFNDPNRLQ